MPSLGITQRIVLGKERAVGGGRVLGPRSHLSYNSVSIPLETLWLNDSHTQFNVESDFHQNRGINSNRDILGILEVFHLVQNKCIKTVVW